MTKSIKWIIGLSVILLFVIALKAPLTSLVQNLPFGKSQTAAGLNSIPDAPEIEALTSAQLFDKLILAGLLTEQQKDAFLNSLTFEHVLNILTPEQTLTLLVDNNLVNAGSVGSLEATLSSWGVSLTHLRAQGVLQALLTPDNAHYHALYPSGTGPQTAKDALETVFNADKIAFINVLSKNYILFMLDGERLTSASDPVHTFHGFSWGSLNLGGTFTNTSHTPFMRSDYTAEQLAAQINAQTPGKRGIIPWNFMENNTYPNPDSPEEVAILKNCGSVCTTRYDIRDPGSSYIHQYSATLWQDEWAERTRTNLLAEFAALKAAGADIDTIVGDIEEGTMLDTMISGAAPSTIATPSISIWQDIANDSRWPALAARIGIDPASILNVPSWTNEQHRQFNAVMAIRTNEYIKYAVLDPARQYYPNIKFTNWGTGYSTQTMLGDYFSICCWLTYGGLTGIPESARDSWYSGAYGGYGWFDTIAWFPNTNIVPTDPPLPPGGVSGPTAYRTPFGALVWDLVLTRNDSASQDNGGIGWYSDKGYRSGAYGPNSGTVIGFYEDFVPPGDGDVLYGERIFHNGLMGARDYALWNPDDHVPPNGHHTAADDQLFDGLMREMTEMVGYTNRYPLSFSPIVYADKYILSCMDAGGRQICRYTPKTGESSLAYSGFQFSQVLASENPATFNLIGGGTFTIPNSHVVHPSVEYSDAGYWVVKDYVSYLEQDLDTTVTEFLNYLNGLIGPVVTFTAAPNPVAYNTTSVLAWSSPTATGCVASGGWSGAKDVTGTFTTPPLTQNTTYILQCENEQTTTTRSVTVTVNPDTSSDSNTGGGGGGGSFSGGGGTGYAPGYNPPTYTPPGIGSIHIKAVGKDHTTATTPQNISFSVDAQALPLGPVGIVQGVPSGSHKVVATDLAAYQEFYGICVYPVDGKECSVTEDILTQPMTCDGGTCSVDLYVTNDQTTKIAIRYGTGSSITAPAPVTLPAVTTGSIKIKSVDGGLNLLSADAVGVTVDGGNAFQKNPVLYLSKKPGDHTITVSAPDEYSSYAVGTCQYSGTKECVVSNYANLTCGSTCATKVKVTAGKTTKVVFRFGGAPSGTTVAPSAPAPTTPPPTTPTSPVTPTLPPSNPGTVSFSCLPFPASVSLGDAVVWKAYPVPAGTYTYAWSGTDGLSGSAVSVSKIYTTAGTKTAKVTINGQTKDCNKTVTVKDY